MIPSSSPAVILNNIPNSLRKNGQTVADVVLGSKTGKEVGVAFWKIHQTQPRFMIVFKHKEDRGRWIKTSPMLKKFMTDYQVRITLVLYNRDRDLVIGEDEGVTHDLDWRSRPPNNRGQTSSSPKETKNVSNVNTTRASDTSSINVSCLGAIFEDLDKLNVSQLSISEPFVKKADTIEVKAMVHRGATELDVAEATELDVAAAKLKEKLAFPDFLQPMSKLGLAGSKMSSLNKSTTSNVPETKNDVDTTKKKREAPTNSKPTKSFKNTIPTTRGADLVAALSDQTEKIVGLDVTIPPPGLPVDVSLPPPPLRLPLHVFPPESQTDLKSNILEKLATAAERHFEGSVEEKIAMAQVLKDSWIESMEKLENLYEKVLGEQGLVSEDLGLELSSIYKFEGNGKLSRSKALLITKDFLSQSGKMVGSDFNDRFLKFLSDNPDYKVSNEEIDHIMTRNGVDLFALFKVYSREQSVSTLKDKLRDQVNLGGQLFMEFSQTLTDFFNLNLTRIRTRKQTSVSTSTFIASPQKNVKAHQNLIQADLTKLQQLLSKKDFKNSISVLKDVRGKVTRFSKETEERNHEISTLKANNMQLIKDLNSAKEEAKERMKTAQQENKILRSRNSGLNDEALDAKERLSQALAKLDFVCKTLDSLAVGDDVQFDLDVNNNKDASVIQKDLDGFMRSVNALKSMYQGQRRGNQGQGHSRVNLITSEGKKFFVHTNRNNNIFVPELEKMIGKAVTGLRVPNLLGSGYTEFPARNGYIDSPQLGWINRDYEVTEQESIPLLGQGCTNTSGLGQRRAGDGPMFPPHVIGPRIATS